MKLREAILTEATIYQKYEDFDDALMQTVSNKSYGTFKQILETALRNKQYEFFSRYFQKINGNDEKMMKELFKQSTPF